MYLLLMFHMINVYKCYCLPRKSKYRFGVWTNSWTKLATLAVSVLTAILQLRRIETPEASGETRPNFTEFFRGIGSKEVKS